MLLFDTVSLFVRLPHLHDSISFLHPGLAVISTFMAWFSQQYCKHEMLRRKKFGVTEPELVSIYTYLCLVLEYAVPVWHSSLTVDHSKRLESTQNKKIKNPTWPEVLRIPRGSLHSHTVYFSRKTHSTVS